VAAPAGNPHAVLFHDNAKAKLVTEDFKVLPPRAPKTPTVSVSRCAPPRVPGGTRPPRPGPAACLLCTQGLRRAS
jgi:hypothetical protein